MSQPQPPQAGSRSSTSNKRYQRAYKACLRCRQTKAKCEPHLNSQSCTKCSRESRVCEFPSERFAKKRKTETRASLASGPIPTARQSHHSHVTSPQEADDPPREDDTSHNYEDEVVDTVVTTSTDALGLLFRAAEQQASKTNREHGHDPSPDSGRSNLPGIQSSETYPATIPISWLSSASTSEFELWNQHSFVRQGYFSAVEAITYVNLFLQNLACLSPISSFISSIDSMHQRLIQEEPLLCCAILMISSRYHVLPGPGAASRADLIHMRLWKQCEALIARLTFGQERYSDRKLRSIGSVQALLLLTEWHARSLHFPPEHDGWDASYIAGSLDDQHRKDRGNTGPIRWKQEVSEPAKRSDRMSWMLVGLATSLAHELGVFEDPESEDYSQVFSCETQIRTQRLLFVYVNQLSLRINRTSSLPQNLNLDLTPAMREHADVSIRERDSYISQFIEITKLRRATTEVLFASKAATRQIMRSGRHVSLLEHFQPLFDLWLQRFRDTEFTTLPKSSEQILFLDYCYVKTYTFSIAMQAVVERAKSRGEFVALDFEFVRKETEKEYAFIGQVIDTSRSILATAVELAETRLLRYCPVRVFISITSAAIFLLKAISLGTRQSELSKSLEILEKCTHALRHDTYDDMHLASKYGQLLDSHIGEFKKGFHAQAAVTTSKRKDHSSVSTPLSQAPQSLDRTGLRSSNDRTTGEQANTVVSNSFNPGVDHWLAQPFDPAFAPFDFDLDQTVSGLELNSLDFFWNLSS